MSDRITVTKLKEMKATGEKIACLTAYDASFARVEDEAGIDVILVGDSLGMVLHGENTTRNVTMDNMVYHTCLVSRVRQRALIISDMPFQSYSTPEQAVGNAMRLVNEGGADVVKLEGGEEMTEVITAIKHKGIPVCGHLGLTPQSYSTSEGFRVQATTGETAEKLRMMRPATLCEKLLCVNGRDLNG